MKPAVLIDRITNKEHIFNQGDVKTIGRDPKCSIVTQSGEIGISRVHAIAEYDAFGNFFVRDKKSRNGIYLFIDGEKTRVYGSYQINPGDSFYLGPNYEMNLQKRDIVAERNAEERARAADTQEIECV